MSFRLWIFTLVMVVAVTAIGATAWLTLSLTSREVERSQEAQQQHQHQIVEEIQRYGLTHGNWPGIDRVVADLSERTDLHIRIHTTEGQVLADSDTIANRSVGPVRGVALDVDPLPVLDSAVEKASPSKLDDKLPTTVVVRYAAEDLYGKSPRDAVAVSRPVRMLKQIAQYRVALVTVRCASRKTRAEPAMGLTEAPYLSEQQMQADPACLRPAIKKVTGDIAWLTDIADQYFRCVRTLKPGIAGNCAVAAFSYGAGTTSAIP